jgi:glycosyltransferase involved in cell wall biosynthesis
MTSQHQVQSPRRVLFVLPSLGGGGAERSAIDLLRGLDRQRFATSLALFSRDGSFSSQLPADVQVYDLRGRKQYDLRLVLRVAKLLRRQQPEIVFSVLRYANVITLLAHGLARSSSRLIVNEQNLPSAEFALFGGSRLKGLLLRQLYPQADAVTAISRGIVHELVSTFGVVEDKVHIIHNPVDLVRVQALGAAELLHPWFQPRPEDGETWPRRRDDETSPGWPVIVAAGRLHPQKGFTHLLRAFAQVRNALPCKLVVLGEGPLRSELEQLIVTLGLSDDVILPGFQENPYNYIRGASVFVLSSLFEGFGIVLVEALALGTPVVSTRCPVGPDEILLDGETGILVPPADDRALAQAILRVLQDERLRQKLAANGPGRAADFALPRIVSQYEQLFDSLLGA